MLTSGQIAHFETFGFLVLRQVFSQAEVSSIQSEFDAVWSEASGGRPWSGETTESRQPFCEMSPPLTKLVADDRVFGPVEQLLGANVIWGASGATRYVGDSGWHADDYNGLLDTYRAIKVVMYLEPVEKDTGCLRIIPGSHHRSFYRELRPIDQQHSDLSRMPFSVPGRDTPGYPMETQPADLLIFDTRAYHGAFGGEPGRSNIQMVIDHAGEPDERTDEYYQAWRRGMKDLAQADNVVCKISGLGMADNDWTVDSIRPWVLSCIEIFGSERCVFGANWPVDKLYGSYDVLIDAYAEIIADFSDDEQEAMFSRNAEDLYRI